ncbi:ferredoxin [Fodinicola feengrottensis]|uniref:Ferredoxin n=1 Tax=Fodinicola feengrottensis TaxID=435914 RepID=A0ABN2J6Z4_9ACTN|nr:ferredoxin [Fodinicola feengrottensis]
MRIVADRERCIGAGQCVRVAPELFDQDESEGIVVVLRENPPPELAEAATEAAQLCPSQAIAIAAALSQGTAS